MFSCHFGFAVDWENWVENARMPKGAGGKGGGGEPEAMLALIGRYQSECILSHQSETLLMGR